jgi:hypothetical protein
MQPAAARPWTVDASDVGWLTPEKRSRAGVAAAACDNKPATASNKPMEPVNRIATSAWTPDPSNATLNA